MLTCFYGNEACFFFEKKKIFKIANSQYFFKNFIDVKGSTYVTVRLPDITSKTGKTCIFCVFRPFSMNQNLRKSGNRCSIDLRVKVISACCGTASYRLANTA